MDLEWLRAGEIRGPLERRLRHRCRWPKSSQRQVNEWDEFTGRLEAVEKVEVRPRVSGYIERIAFREGAEVNKGDLLFEIDPRPFQTELNRAEAELARAQSQFELAQSQLRRARGTAADRISSRSRPMTTA